MAVGHLSSNHPQDQPQRSQLKSPGLALTHSQHLRLGASACSSNYEPHEGCCCRFLLPIECGTPLLGPHWVLDVGPLTNERECFNWHRTRTVFPGVLRDGLLGGNCPPSQQKLLIPMLYKLERCAHQGLMQLAVTSNWAKLESMSAATLRGTKACWPILGQHEVRLRL
jgi:hypothetical protein